MANVSVPVTVILTDEELGELSHGGYITAALCSKCHALVPLELIPLHDQELHNGS